MKHFEDKISIWPVMNQFHPARWGGKDVLRDVIGNELIEIAFKTAREADPSAILIYNDGNNHALNMNPDGLVFDNTMDIVSRLKTQNLIDGVGLHMHLDGAHPPPKQAVIEAMKKYGLPVYVTEFDVDMEDVHDSDVERNKIQTKIYQDMVEAAVESGVVHSFILFGVGDQYSHLERSSNNGSPLADPTPFDDKLEPKPAYYAMLLALYNRFSNYSGR